MKKILIMAGGTGGHVIPALTVAEALQAKQIAVEWLGCREGLEATLVPQSNITLHFIPKVPLRGKNIKSYLLAPYRLLRALIIAIHIIRHVKPDTVIGMGGFASFPGGVAARLLRKKLVIHEQNAVAGLANRWLAKIAQKTLQAFPNTFTDGITIGNPIRKAILQLPPPQQRLANRQGKLRLLIMGGSLGALTLNTLIINTLKTLSKEQQPDIWHIAGAGKTEQVEQGYREIALPAAVDAYVDNLAEAYQWADVVLARAGALTVSELAVVGIASILVPFPYSVDDHQTFNAKWLADAGAAIIVQQRDLTAKTLKTILLELMQDRERLLQMAQAGRHLAKRDATSKMLSLLCNSSIDYSD